MRLTLKLILPTAALASLSLVFSGPMIAQQTPAGAAAEAQPQTEQAAGAQAQIEGQAQADQQQTGAQAEAQVDAQAQGQAGQQGEQTAQPQDAQQQEAAQQTQQQQDAQQQQRQDARQQQPQLDQRDQRQRAQGRQQQQLDAQAEGELGLQLQSEGQTIRVANVEEGSVFAEAGLRSDDQIIAVGGRQFSDARQIETYLRQASGEVPIVVMRDGERQVLYVQSRDTIASPSDRPFAQRQGRDNPSGLGVTFDGSRQQEAIIIRVVQQSPAEDAGLQEGDVVVQVNGQQHDGPFATAMAIHRHRPGQQIALTVDRDGQQQELQATLETWQEAFAQADFQPVPPQIALRRMQSQQAFQGQAQGSMMARGEQEQRHTVMRPEDQQQLDAEVQLDQQRDGAAQPPQLPNELNQGDQGQGRAGNQGTPDVPPPPQDSPDGI